MSIEHECSLQGRVRLPSLSLHSLPPFVPFLTIVFLRVMVPFPHVFVQVAGFHDEPHLQSSAKHNVNRFEGSRYLCNQILVWLFIIGRAVRLAGRHLISNCLEVRKQNSLPWGHWHFCCVSTCATVTLFREQSFISVFFLLLSYYRYFPSV